MIVNPSTSESYTNKDFQSIYPEMLDLVKQLTKKWDPSISNESDPGVVLLKLNAIVADKNNYNIDKNILEAFPDTVTQEVNARNLYKQLGYNMSWYNSSECTVRIRYTGTPKFTEGTSTEDYIIQIPKFTKITDSSAKIIYTTKEEVTIEGNSFVDIDCYEGTLSNVVINNSSVITLSALDSKNRVYLGDTSVAQNAVWVQDSETGNLWEVCSNLSLYASGSRVYEFGVDARSGRCYIEFPNDIASLIGSGVVIQYLVTQGARGAVSKGTLDRFHEDISLTASTTNEILNEQTSVSPSDFEIKNINDSVEGRDPESLDEAYLNYRKTVGTFSTLVTIRDYLNYILKYDKGTSNGFVTDRLNDPQCSYTVKTSDAGLGEYNYVVKTTIPANENGSVTGYRLSEDISVISDKTYYKLDSKGCMSAVLAPSDSPVENSYYEKIQDVLFEEDSMTAFDLKLYLLSSGDDIMDYDTYTKTFSLRHSDEVNPSVSALLQTNAKVIQHNFRDILPNTPCMFKNVYGYNIRVVPQRKLQPTEIYEIQKNIQQALMISLQSSNCEFGKEPSYDKVYRIVENADSRIKSCFMSDFQNTVYAVYWDGARMAEIPITNIESCSRVCIFPEESTIPDGTTVTGLEQVKNKILAWNSSNKTSRIYDTFFFIENNDLTNYDVYTVTKYPLSSVASLQDLTSSVTTENPDSTDKLLYKHSIDVDEIRKDIVAKSILCGATPLFVPADQIQQNILEDSLFKGQLTDTSKISTELVIQPWNSLSEEGSTLNVTSPIETQFSLKEEDGTKGAYEYTVRNNETVRFFTPQFKDDQVYSNYIKYHLESNEAFIQVDASVEGQYIGEVTITNEDFNKVCLNGWRDHTTDNPPTIDNDRKYVFPPNTQSVLDIKYQSPEKWGQPTTYTVEIRYGMINNHYPVFQDIHKSIQIWQYTDTVCSTGKSVVDVFDDMREASHLTDSNTYVYNDNTGILKIRYLKPSNINSFSLYFISPEVIVVEEGEEQPNHTMSLANISVKSWITINSAPEFITPDGMIAYRFRKDEDPEVIQMTVPSVNDLEHSTVSTDYIYCLPFDDANENYVGFPGFYDAGAKNPDGSTQYLLLEECPRTWSMDAPSYYAIVHSWPGADYTAVSTITASRVGEESYNGWAYIPNFYYQYDAETETYSLLTKTYDEMTEAEKQAVYNGLTSDDITPGSEETFYVSKLYVMDNVAWEYKYRDNPEAKEECYYGTFRGIEGSYEWTQDETTTKWSTTLTSSDASSHPELTLARERAITFYKDASPRVISANETYELQADESIVFFWKEEDADYAPYQYRKYAAGEHICPNFDIAFNKRDSSDFMDLSLKSGEISTSDADRYSIVRSLVTDLSATKSVAIRVVDCSSSSAEEAKNPIQSFFFLSRDKDPQGKNRLVFVRIAEGSKYYQRTLDDGEMLYCLDSKKESLLTFGAGTLLQIESSSCEADHIEKLCNGFTESSVTSASSVEDIQQLLVTIDNDEILRCYEQQVTSVGEGSKIELIPVPDNVGNVRIIYDRPASAVEGEFSTYFSETSKARFYSWGHTLLSGHTVRIDGKSVVLPNIHTTSLQVTAKPYLNIITSTESPQIIHLNDTSGEGVSHSRITIDTKVFPSNEQNSVKLYASSDLSKVGGYDLSLRSLDIDGAVDYPSLLITSINDTVEGATLNSSTGIVKVSAKTGVSDLLIPRVINSAGAQYLLKVSVLNKDYQPKLKLSGDGVPDKYVDPLSKEGLYYYYILSKQDGYTKMSFEGYSDYPEAASTEWLVYPLIQLDSEPLKWELETHIDRSSIINKIQELDFEGRFDYTYCLDKSLSVLNPLNSSSFFEPEHPFNSVTIAQADTRLVDYRSSVEIVNNRG